jgi:hypothetical protein
LSKRQQTLEQLGFAPAAEVVQPRNSLIMSVNARTGCGKTRFALTMPKPIAFFNFDRQIEQDIIDHLGINPATDLFIKDVCIDEGDAEDIIAKEWNDFRNAYNAVLKSDEIVSVAVDTFCAVHEAVRLRLFGKLVGVKPHHYAQVNFIMRSMLKLAEKAGKNVVYCHRLKKEYKENKSGDSSWTGNFEPKGYADAQYEVPVVLNLFKDDDGFNAEVTKSGIRAAEVEGRVFMNDEINFANIAAEVTGSIITEWM